MTRPVVRAKPVVRDGMRFDSRAESSWFAGLELRERIGDIRELQRQPEFVIDFPSGRRACVVKADAAWWADDGPDGEPLWHVADYKGRAGDTPVSALKRRLVWARHGVEIEWVGPGAKPLRVKRDKPKSKKAKGVGR